MKYSRTVDGDFIKLLSADGPLHPFVNPGSLAGIPLDAQLRYSNRLSIYAGLTVIADIRWSRKHLSVTARDVYKAQGADLFTTHALDTTDLMPLWNRFREVLQVDQRYLDNEGALQALLMDRYGRRYRAGDDWCLIDREAVVQHDDETSKGIVAKAIKDSFRDVVLAIEADRTIIVGKNAQRSFGDEADLLGVTATGDIVVGEVKDGSDTKGVYMSPVQVAGYCQMWTRLRTAAQVADDINALIEQKIGLGLLPTSAPRVRRDFEIKPIVLASEPSESSSAWRTFGVVRGHVTSHHPQLLGSLTVYTLVRTCDGIECRPRT